MRAPQIIWCLFYGLILFHAAFQLGSGERTRREFVGMLTSMVLINLLVWWGGFFG